jgi:predicted transglutaminase-like cysteine proteinase
MIYAVRFILLLVLTTFSATLVTSHKADALTQEGAFGSVAISAPNNAFRAQWLGALAEHADAIFLGDCQTGELCESPMFKSLSHVFEALASKSPLEKLQTVNAAVNHAIIYTTDKNQYGVEDYWALARETLASGRGDCEDIAILKIWMLRAAGFAAEALTLVVVKEQARDLHHAVLVVRLGGLNLVLDNLTGAVKPDTQIASYQPVVSFSTQGSWIHGFRRPVLVARAN